MFQFQNFSRDIIADQTSRVIEELYIRKLEMEFELEELILSKPQLVAKFNEFLETIKDVNGFHPLCAIVQLYNMCSSLIAEYNAFIRRFCEIEKLCFTEELQDEWAMVTIDHEVTNFLEDLKEECLKKMQEGAEYKIFLAGLKEDIESREFLAKMKNLFK